MQPRWAVVGYVGVQVAIALVGLLLKILHGGCYPFAWQMFSCA